MLVTPNELLRRKIALAGLSASDLAKQIGVHVQTIYNVTGDKRGISAGLALKLAHRFVEPAEVWMADEIEIVVDEDGAMSEARPARAENASDDIADARRYADYAENVDGILVDREIEALLSSGSGGVVITPYTPENVQPASYDLTVGLIIDRGFRGLSEYEWGLVLRSKYDRDAPTNRETQHVQRRIEDSAGDIRCCSEILLKRGESAVVMAREAAVFGKNYLADVGSTSSQAREGLLVNHGFQIDPGFQGAIFVTVMNIGIEDFRLRAGDKLVSLALHRLARAPDRAYRLNTTQAVHDIADRIANAIKGLFACEELLDAGYQAKTDRFDRPSIGRTKNEALDKAVASVLSILAEPDLSDPDDEQIVSVVGALVNRMPIKRSEAEALIEFLGVDDRAKSNALKHFSSAQDYQTLGATLGRLTADPIVGLRGIMDLTPSTNI